MEKASEGKLSYLQKNLVTLSYGLLYFFCSASMLLFNKLAINSYPAPALLILIQYTFCVFIVSLLSCFSFVDADPLRWEVVKKYWPVPALFACAIFANNKILQYANIETFIVVRNTTPLFVATIEFFLMGKNIPSVRSLFCFLLIIFGAVCYGLTDQGFRLESYLWAIFYIIVLCSEMVFVKHIFNSVKMTTWGRMLYTNSLSIPFQPVFIYATQEYLLYSQLILTSTGFIYICLTCIGGFGISFAGIGFRSRVSATTFTLIGVVNKVITITVNYFMWEKHASTAGLVSLALCLIGSTLYQPASFREPNSNSVSDRAWNCCNSLTQGCCERMQLERDDNRANKAAAGETERPKSSGTTGVDEADEEERESLLKSGSAKSIPSLKSRATLAAESKMNP